MVHMRLVVPEATTHLPLFDLESELLGLLLQLPLALLALFDIALELGLEFLARRLELLQLDFQRLILRLVVSELLLQAAPSGPGRRGVRGVGIIFGDAHGGSPSRQ